MSTASERIREARAIGKRYIIIGIPSWTPTEEAREFAQEINDEFQPHHKARLMVSINGRIDTLDTEKAIDNLLEKYWS